MLPKAWKTSFAARAGRYETPKRLQLALVAYRLLCNVSSTAICVRPHVSHLRHESPFCKGMIADAKEIMALIHADALPWCQASQRT